MGVTPGHFRLSAEQRRFRSWLSAYPMLVGYWDFEHRRCETDQLLTDLPMFSHAEQLMGRFFLSVWAGNDAVPFPLIEAVRTLDTAEMNNIVEWMREPYFP